MKKLWSLISNASTLASIGQWLWSWPFLSSSLLTVASALTATTQNIPFIEWIFYIVGIFSLSILFWNQFDAYLKRNAIRHKLSYANLYFQAVEHIERNENIAVQVGVVLRNTSPEKKIYYRIDNIRVIISDITVTEPHFINTGGYITPNNSDTFRYPRIEGIPNDSFVGVIEYTCHYGKSETHTPFVIRQKIRFHVNKSPAIDPSSGRTPFQVAETEILQYEI